MVSLFKDCYRQQFKYKEMETLHTSVRTWSFLALKSIGYVARVYCSLTAGIVCRSGWVQFGHLFLHVVNGTCGVPVWVHLDTKSTASWWEGDRKSESCSFIETQGIHALTNMTSWLRIHPHESSEIKVLVLSYFNSVSNSFLGMDSAEFYC